MDAEGDALRSCFAVEIDDDGIELFVRVPLQYRFHGHERASVRLTHKDLADQVYH
jgi:hypothetical protein